MRKILVIDDEELFRRTILVALRQKGFQTFEARNGASGLEVARSEVPDLVISDVRMDHGDGYSVLEGLRKHSITAAIPVILMTGAADAAGMRHGMDLGADDYLPKPFSPAQLWAAVDARLKKQTAVKELAEKKLADLRTNLCLMLPHELNTPLIGILGCGEIIAREAFTLSPCELAEMGRDILSSGQRLQRLVQNFLIYAQIELLGSAALSQQTWEQSSSEGYAAVLETITRTKAVKLGRSVDLNLETANELSPNISRECFAKMIEELLDNAFKFSPSGTPVTVETSAKHNSLHFLIRDCGCGMSGEQIAEMSAFMQFQRQLKEQQGAGLGLAIAGRLAELHGGKLSFESVSGNGTTVRVVLPASSRSSHSLSGRGHCH